MGLPPIRLTKKPAFILFTLVLISLLAAPGQKPVASEPWHRHIGRMKNHLFPLAVGLAIFLITPSLRAAAPT
ncbi:MAG: hypothetical protein ACKVKM_12550, partial [Verrucomicrobiia bacterium]